ncbi:MAG: PilZ domain-containing protein [Vulcanimicrobiota bacterium]
MKWGQNAGYGVRRPKQSSEKRRYQRIKMILGIVCHRQDKPDVTIFTDDVSMGGLKFTSQDKMERDEELKIDLPVGLGRYKKVIGRVVWFRKGLINSYEGGVEFEDMDENIVRSWEKFIERNIVK